MQNISQINLCVVHKIGHKKRILVFWREGVNLVSVFPLCKILDIVQFWAESYFSLHSENELSCKVFIKLSLSGSE